jgi:hypothetical protein
MLGEHCDGVTKAASALRKRNLIGYCRGKITIIDRNGLEAASCGLHGRQGGLRQSAGIVCIWCRLKLGNNSSEPSK